MRLLVKCRSCEWRMVVEDQTHMIGCIHEAFQTGHPFTCAKCGHSVTCAEPEEDETSPAVEARTFWWATSFASAKVLYSIVGHQVTSVEVRIVQKVPQLCSLTLSNGLELQMVAPTSITLGRQETEDASVGTQES